MCCSVEYYWISEQLNRSRRYSKIWDRCWRWMAPRGCTLWRGRRWDTECGEGAVRVVQCILSCQPLHTHTQTHTHNSKCATAVMNQRSPFRIYSVICFTSVYVLVLRQRSNDGMTGETEVLVGKPLQLPLCPPQISHILAWNPRLRFGNPCYIIWLLFTKPIGHYMYRTVVTICTTSNIQQFYVLPTQCIYVFCVDLRTNSDYFPIQH